jgi:hypothetical protein
MPVKWTEPSVALPLDESDTLSTAQVDAWREDGFCLVDNVFPDDLVSRACSAAAKCLPAPNDAESAVGATKMRIGFNTNLFFPFRDSNAFNEVTLHPRLLRAIEQLLYPDDPSAFAKIRLTQSEVWPKFGGKADETRGQFDNVDQRMHCDFPNHTLTFPTKIPEVCSLIVYYNSVEECGGYTAVVPNENKHRDDEAYRYPRALTNLPGFGELPWINDRATAETYLEAHDPKMHAFRAKLYERELACQYGVGSVLFYRHDVWHRGTALIPGRMRRVHNLTFKRSDCEW